MIGKLYKHEFATMFRYLIPIGAVVWGLALLLRIFCYFPEDIPLVRAILLGVGISYYFAFIAAMIVGYVLLIERFYRNLFTQEGYLTFTLPIKPAQHLWCKLIVGICMQYALLLILLFSFLIVGWGNPDLYELFYASFTGMQELLVTLNPAVFFGSMAEILFLNLPLAFADGLLSIYFCIAVGQTFAKNRIAGAVAVYIIRSVALQFLLCFLFMLCGILLPQAFLEWLNSLPLPAILGLLAVLECILPAVYFAVTHHIVKHRLNLE